MLPHTIQPTRFDVDAMRIGVEHAVLTVAGQVDLATIDDLRHPLSELLTTGVRFLVVDLSAVSFLGSLGLEAIVNTHDYTRAQGGWLVLIDPPSIVARLLALIEPTKRFAIYPSARQASPGGPPALVRRLSTSTAVRPIGTSIPRANSARTSAAS